MKRFALKRITALVLALVMTLSLCPVSAWAEVLESAPVYEFSGSYVAEDDGVSNEEAFAAYFQRELDASLGYETPSFYSTSALKEGTLEKEVYDLVKAELTKIAEGSATSADIRVYPTKGWSTEDLGVPELSSGNGLSAEADAAITAKLNLVYNCLLADCPMELYWHDKTLSASFGMSGISISEENSLQTMKPNMVSYAFIVATDYRDNADVNHVTTDASITGATSAAINNAEAIVSANAAKSDFEKLKAYKDAICALVSYNDEAAASTSTTDGINPWQMIWVFDEDSATEVVCEGYAKAFQYLCDLSTFSGDVECHTVSGTMSGGTGAGRHMWNVVTMDDGENYLVDVTNCDTGTIGADGELFMASTTNSANSNQTHTFTINGENVVFTYDEAMADLFCDGYLAISETAYVESVQGYVPLYWSDDNGVTYHNGIDEPYEQPLYNDGRMASLFVKSGDTYVALDEATFGNETITKLSEDIGFFGWVEGRNRVFWNTEGAVEGTESGAVFTVGQTQYLINLKVRVSTTEELAVGFSKNYLYDYTAQEYYTTATFDNAWKLCNAKLSFDALSAERQAAILNIVPNAGDMLAAGRFIYCVLDGHKYNGQHFVEITDSTSDRDVAEFLGGYGTWNTLTAAQKTMVNDALKAIGGQYTVEQMYEAAAERNSEEARWFPAGTSGWEDRGTLAEAVEYANSLTDGTALIQLLSDVKTDTPLVFNSDTKTILDLNGHTIDRGLTEAVEGGNVITVYGDLWLNDDSTTDVTKQGKITGGYTADPVNNVGGGPGGVKVMGSFTMYGGNITGNKGTAGGVQVLSGFFTMSGGAITNNEASYTGMGGGVYVNNGSMFEMVGGEISGNVADGKEEGTTVYGGLGGGVWNGGEFIMRGGKITGNTAMYGAGVKGSLYVSGSPVITGNISNLNNQQQANNVHLFSGETAYILGALTTEASIGVTTGTMPTATNPVTVALGSNYTVTASDAAAFFGDAGFDVILTNGGSVQLTPSSQVVPGATLSGDFVNGEVGVAIFTDLDENGVLGVDAPIYGYGGVVAAADVIACGKQSQQIYLAVGANQTLSVKQGNQQISITNIGTWTPTWGPAGADTPHDVYVLEATKNGDEDVSVYTVTRENESFTLTVDFSPAYSNSGDKQVSARGVHVFTDLDTANNTLSCDDSVVQFGNQNIEYVYVTCGNVTSRTVYLAAEQWDSLSVTDGNGNLVPISKVGMWPTQYTDQNGNPFDVTCKVYALEVAGNSGIVEYTATRSWSYWFDHDGDPNTEDQLVNDSEDVTLTVDFTPALDHGGYCMEWGVGLFDDLNSDTLICGDNVRGAYILCAGKTNQKMYLTAFVDRELTVKDENGQTVALTQVGVTSFTVNNGEEIRPAKVYEMTAVQPNSGNEHVYTIITSFDPSVTTDDETFDLTFDFSPLYTSSGNTIGARGAFLFTDKNGTEFSCDTSSVSQWGNPSGEYLYLTCGDVTSRTVYLAVSQWDNLSVSGFATLPKVGTWVATFTDENGDPFQETCNVYEVTVPKPATGKTVDYTVNSGTAHGESEHFTLTFDFAPALSGNIEMGASNIVFFTDLNGNELSCDTSSAAQWGNANGEHVYFTYGDTDDDQTMYLATSPRDTIAVKNGAANVPYTHVGTTTFKTMEGNDWLCKVYEVPVPAPASDKTVEYTVEHEWIYWENDQPVSQKEDLFFTFDFAPELTGELYNAERGVLLFTNLNNTTLGYDEDVYIGGHDGAADITILDKTSQTMYLGFGVHNDFTVQSGGQNVPMTYMGVWSDPNWDSNLYRVYKVEVDKPADGNIVVYDVTNAWWNWENGVPSKHEEQVPLTFDFSPVFTHTGEAYGCCGVTVFNNKSGTVLSGNSSDYSWWDDNNIQHMSVACGDVPSQTVYLSLDQWSTLTVQQGQNAAFTPTKLGKQIVQGTTDQGETVDVMLDVYELTVPKPVIGTTVDYTVTRSWSWYDESIQQEVKESESFTLVFDFSPEFTCNEDGMLGAYGIFTFTGLEDGVLLQDRLSVAQWHNADESFGTAFLCGDVPSRTVYLGVGKWDTLSVSGGATPVKVGTWTTTHTDGTETWESVYNIYKLTVAAPAEGNTVEYTAIRSLSWYDENLDEEVTESYTVELVFDFSPLFTGEDIVWENGMPIFTELNGSTLGYDMDVLVAGHGQWAEIFSPGRTSQTLYLGVDYGDAFEAFSGTEDLDLAHVGVWRRAFEDGGYAIHNIYKLEAEKPADSDVVEFNTERTAWYWKNGKDFTEQKLPVRLTVDFAPLISVEDDYCNWYDLRLFTDYDTVNSKLTCGENILFGSDYAMNVLASGTTSKTVYVACDMYSDLTITALGNSDNLAVKVSGRWFDGNAMYNIYQLTATKPQDSYLATYVVTYTMSGGQSEAVMPPLVFNFAPTLTGDLRNMEGGVALFSGVNENNVLVSDNSIRGMRGSALVLCGGSDAKTLYLAAPLTHGMTVIDSASNKNIPDCVGVWNDSGDYFNVYALTVDKPADGGEVVYTVRRTWTYWENDEIYEGEESFPVTFDFTLNPDETMPLTIDGIRIYSYLNDGKLGYFVPYMYDELGVDDDNNFVMVPSRPNQDKTIYLVSDEILSVNGTELPKCTNLATVGNKTVYELTAKGQDFYDYTAVIDIGDTGNTMTVRFVFVSVFFTGTSFYTAIDEDFEGYFSYEDRTTCDGLSIEFLPVPEAEHFYLDVPYDVGEEKTLYICPEWGDIADITTAEGSLDAQYYSFEEVEDNFAHGYSKYYKLTLSDALNETKNQVLRLFNEQGEEIGNIDVIFRPTESSFEACWNLADSAETPVRGSLKQAMTYANSLTSGTAYIQLIKDVKTDAPLVFAEGTTTILDLNGYTIDRGLAEATEAVNNGNVITVNGDLTLCDTSEEASGVITGGAAYNGGGVYVKGDATFAMSGGSITGNSAIVAITGDTIHHGGNGGGVCVDENSTFTMSGGSIIGNNAGFGGGVYIPGGGNFIMTGGSITANTANSVYNEGGDYYIGGVGGGVCLQAAMRPDDNGNLVPIPVVFTVSGKPVVNGNTADGETNNLVGKHITVGELTSGTSVGVTSSLGVFTTGGAEYADSGYFFSDSNEYLIVGDGSNLMLAAKRTVSFNANNGTDQTAKPFEVAYGRKFMLPERPENTITAPAGMQFKGWAYSADGAVITDSIITVTSDVTLYAIWENIPAETPVVAVSNDLVLVYGNSGNEEIRATVTEQSGYSYTYQWYDAEDQLIVGATNAAYVIPAEQPAGEYTYYCVVTAIRDDNNEAASAKSAIITVTVGKAEQEAPAVAGVNETIYGKNDGKITGVTSAMEYSTDGVTYNAVEGTVLENLAPDTYYVRYAESDTHFASKATEVTITAGKKITVIFDTNGANAISPVENLAYGDKVAIPQKPVKAEHLFLGWFSDTQCTKAWNFVKDVVVEDMTLYAAWEKIPRYKISGTVVELNGNDENVVDGATVKLMLGSEQIVSTTTDASGNFSFGGQLEGNYNLVVEHTHESSNHAKVVTTLVELHSDVSDVVVTLPKDVTNSKVEHKNTGAVTAGTLVGGLEAVAEAVRQEAEEKVDTSSGAIPSEVVAKVEVTMSVEDTPEVTGTPEPGSVEEKKQTEQKAIKEKAPGKEMVFFDLSVMMSVTTVEDGESEQTTDEPISNTVSLLEVRIPFDKDYKWGITIYRYHGDQAEALPEVNEDSPTEGFWIGDDGYIHIYTQKFSTYAVGYTEESGVTVSGTVTSFLDDTATVTIELFVGDEMKYSTTTTGNTANYTLENVESGTYTMKVSKANHVTREYTVTVEDGVVTITENGEAVTGNLKIHPVGDVTGDGVLDTFDVMMSNAHARRTLTLSGYQFACADITNNGVVDTFDVMMANAHARRTLALW